MDDATGEETDTPQGDAISGTASDYGNNEWRICNIPATSKPLAVRGTVDFFSEIAMPLYSTAECAEPRRGLKTVSKLCAPIVLRGDKSLDFQTVPPSA